MKKFILALAAVFTLSMASCEHKNSTSETQTTEPDTEVADSVTVEEAEIDSVVVL